MAFRVSQVAHHVKKSSLPQAGSKP